jgi:hypothetical protein
MRTRIIAYVVLNLCHFWCCIGSFADNVTFQDVSSWGHVSSKNWIWKQNERCPEDGVNFFTFYDLIELFFYPLLHALFLYLRLEFYFLNILHFCFHDNFWILSPPDSILWLVVDLMVVLYIIPEMIKK